MPELAGDDPVAAVRKAARAPLVTVMGDSLNRPDLSVIVVTHNRPDLAVQTIRSARAATGNISVDWHVVDSGSTDPVADVIEREWPDIDVRRVDNIGFAAGNNDALERTRGRYVLLLNPDIEVTAGTLEQLVATLDARPEVGMASVIQRGPDGSIDYSIRRDPDPVRMLAEALAPGRLAKQLRLSEVETRVSRYETESPSDWLCGAFLIARAEAVRDVGGLDERFFLYSEETDWCYRCRRAGWDVRHLPVMTVIHHRNKGYAGDLLAQLTYSRMLFARKHFSDRNARRMRHAAVVNHLVRAMAFGALGAWRDAFAARAKNERRALAVILGRSAPPFARG